MPRLSAAVSRALDLAFPATCVGCGAEGRPVCERCRTALDARLELPAGMPIGLPADLPDDVLQLEWCAPFSGLVRAALHQLKYTGERRLAEPLGAAVARRWARAGVGGDLIVPVPVHPDRAAQRGYDQAVLLATVAAHHLGLPARVVVRREHATTAQFELDRRARAANVAGAFGVASAAEAAAIRDRWIVLVDDVVTTGATLSACATVLIRAGATAVSAVTVARER